MTPDAGEQGPGREAVVDHLDRRAVHPGRVHREHAQDDEAHVAHRAVGDQPLDVGLRQCRERAVDDADHREGRRAAGTGTAPERRHRHVEPQQAVAADLQQHARQQDRARRRRLDVGQRQPGVEREHRHLDRETRRTGAGRSTPAGCVQGSVFESTLGPVLPSGLPALRQLGDRERQMCLGCADNGRPPRRSRPAASAGFPPACTGRT